MVSRLSFPPYAILIFSFILGFCIMGVVAIYFTAVGELVAKERIGMVTGVALIFVRSSVMLSTPLFGLIADLTGTYSSSWISLGFIVFFFTIAFFYFSGKYTRLATVY